MLHQTGIIVLAVALARWQLGPVLEPLALLAGTVLVCWAVTAVVRRVRWLRPLFGLPRGAKGVRPRAAGPSLGSPQMP